MTQHRAARGLPVRRAAGAAVVAVALGAGTAAVLSFTGSDTTGSGNAPPPAASTVVAEPSPGSTALPGRSHTPVDEASATSSDASSGAATSATSPAASPSAPAPTSAATPDAGSTSTTATSRTAGPSASPTVQDTTPPVTGLAEQVPDRGDTATFTLSANEPATFACSLDGAAYRPCTSPVGYTDLSAGWHTFAVRATDTAGNADRTPASTSWHSTGQSTKP